MNHPSSCRGEEKIKASRTLERTLREKKKKLRQENKDLIK